MPGPFDFATVKCMNKNIYLLFYIDGPVNLNEYIKLDDKTVQNCDEVLQNFNISLPDVVKLLAILAYISIDDISFFIFELKDSKNTHKITVTGNKNKPKMTSIDFMEKSTYEPEKRHFRFTIDDLSPELFHKKIKVSKDEYKRYTYLIKEKKNDYVFDLDIHTRTLGNVKFAKPQTGFTLEQQIEINKSEEDRSFTLEQHIEINIYSIYVLVDILKSEVQELERNKKTSDPEYWQKISRIERIEKLKKHLKLLLEMSSLAAALPFRHKKSRRRGSKSVKQRRKLRSKSKSRKLSPKIFRR